MSDNPIFTSSASSYLEHKSNQTASWQVYTNNSSDIVIGKDHKGGTTHSNHKLPTTYTRGKVRFNWGRLAYHSKGKYRVCAETETYRRAGRDRTRCIRYKDVFYPNNSGHSPMAPPNVFPVYFQSYGEMNANTKELRAYNLSLPEHVINKSNNKLLDKINRGKVSMGVELAEAHKTFDYIASKFIFLTKVLKAVKRGDHRTVERLLKLSIKPGRNWSTSVASRFLEVNYAITPIVLGITDAIDYMNSERDFQFSVKQAFSHTTSNGYNQDGTVERHTATVKGHTKVVCRLTKNPINGISKELGLHPSDISSVIWEVVPFSFVVDHGIKIGKWLERANATSGLTLLSAYTSSLITFKGSKSISKLVQKAGRNYDIRESGSSSYEGTYFRRNPHSWPANTIEVPLSNFVKPRNLTIYLALLVSIRG